MEEANFDCQLHLDYGIQKLVHHHKSYQFSLKFYFSTQNQIFKFTASIEWKNTQIWFEFMFLRLKLNLKSSRRHFYGCTNFQVTLSGCNLSSKLASSIEWKKCLPFNGRTAIQWKTSIQWQMATTEISVAWLLYKQIPVQKVMQRLYAYNTGRL